MGRGAVGRTASVRSDSADPRAQIRPSDAGCAARARWKSPWTAGSAAAQPQTTPPSGGCCCGLRKSSQNHGGCPAQPRKNSQLQGGCGGGLRKSSQNHGGCSCGLRKNLAKPPRLLGPARTKKLFGRLAAVPTLKERFLKTATAAPPAPSTMDGKKDSTPALGEPFSPSCAGWLRSVR